MAGAVALKLLSRYGVEILAHTVEIGGIKAQIKSVSEIKANVGWGPTALR
jgi:chorismate synthase